LRRAFLPRERRSDGHRNRVETDFSILTVSMCG
jgi:hypothetical protein